MSDTNENGPRLTSRPVGAVSEETSLLDAEKYNLPQGDQQGGAAVSDRELLTLAAKAAGIQLRPALGGAVFTRDIGDDVWQVWNPLTDDGDAFRLMVKSGLTVSQFLLNKEVAVNDYAETFEIWEFHESDPAAATRRAIVRAAAELGRDMT